MESILFLITAICCFILGIFAGVYSCIQYSRYKQKKDIEIDRKLAREKRKREKEDLRRLL